jgi:lysophospholipase L1-like esterase
MDYHVFLQPEVVFEDDRRLRPADLAIKETTEKLYGDDRVEIMKRARARFPALFAVRGLPFTDVATIAESAGRDQLYLDYCHLTPSGAQAVAERMLPVVLAKVLAHLRPGPAVPGSVASGPA